MDKIKHVAAGSLIQQALSLVIFALMTRQLGASEYGVVAAALALVTSIYNFSSFWIAPYIVKTGATQFHRYGGAGDVFVIAGLISACFGGLGLALMLLLAQYDLLEMGPTAPTLLAMLLIGLLSLYLSRLALQATQRFLEYGIALWLDRLLLLLIISVLLIIDEFNSVHAILASAVSMGLIGASFALYFAWRFLRLKGIPALFNFTDFLQRASPVFASTFFLYFSSAPFILVLTSSIYGYTYTGWLSVAFVLTALIHQPVNWITPSLLPRFTVALESANASVLTDHIRRLVLPLAVPFTFAVTILGIVIIYTPVIGVFLGDDFSAAAIIIAMVMLSSISEVIHLLTVNLLYARQQESFILRATFARGSLLVLLIALFPQFEALPIAYLASSWTSTSIELYAVRDLATRTDIVSLFLMMTTPAIPLLLASQLQWHGFAAIVWIACFAFLFRLAFANKYAYRRFFQVLLTTITRRPAVAIPGDSNA